MGMSTALLASSMLVSAAGTAATSYSQSKAQRAEGNYQKQIFETNARLAEIQAEDATRRGDKAAKDHLAKTKKLIGSQRAAMAAQGLNLKEDDALALQQETAAYGAMDAQEIKNNAFREAWGYKVQANDYTYRGRMAKITGDSTARQSILTGGLGIAKDLSYGLYMNKAGVPRYKEI